MDLTETDLHDLAAFFGRRIDTSLTPTPAPQTRAEERQRAMAWVMALEEAQDGGKLSALLLRISRRFPEDHTLQQACQLIMDPGSRGSDRAAGLAFVAVGAVGAAVLVLATIGTAAALYAGGLPTDPARQVTARAPGFVVEPPAGFAVEPPAGFVVEPALEVVGGSEAEAPQRNEFVAPTGRCTARDGGRVGYWYAGARSPGAPGRVIAFDRAVNVRVDYPDKHNDYFARSHIECVIQPGDHVRISEEPILVPGNRYWVPLVTGDLLAPSQDAMADAAP